MKIKIKMLKKLISVMCAAVMATSSAAVSVGAIDEQQIKEVLVNIDACDNSIKNLERDKERANKDKDDRIKAIDGEIKNDEQLLKYLLNLIVDGENQEANFNRVERDIKANEKQKIKITNDSAKKIRDLDKQIGTKKAEKARLEKNLNNLLNQQDANSMPNNQVQLENELAETWKQIASGCQHDPKGKYESLCWLMASRNILNFFGLEEEQAKLPIQGVQNVIDDYLKRGGNIAHLNNDMQYDVSLGQWLNKNQISTLSTTNCAIISDFNNENDARKRLIEVVKDQIITHFDANNKPHNRMSPIIAGGHSHWFTIVGYYKDTNNVVVVDSLNGYKSESKISVKNIDKLIEERLITKQEEAFMTELIFTAKRNHVDRLDYYVSSMDGFGGQNIVKNQIAQNF